MTINPTEDHRADAAADVPPDVAPHGIEAPGASEAQPEPGIPHAAAEPDLESRIKVRRAVLIGRLGELKADKRVEAAETRHRLKTKLSELAHVVKWGIVDDDGWANLGGPMTLKLEQWLVESAPPLAATNEPS
jgi:hypothetical protein